MSKAKKRKTPTADALAGLQLSLEATRRVRDELVAQREVLADALWAVLKDRVECAVEEAAQEAVSNLEIR